MNFSTVTKNGIFGNRFHFEGKNDVRISQVRRVKKEEDFFQKVYGLLKIY